VSSRVCRFAAIAAGLVILSGLFAAPAFADDSRPVTTHVTIPVDGYVYDSCAAPPRELIYVSGSILSVTHVTLDAGGHFHAVFHGNSQGVDGVGLTSGARYRAISGGQFVQAEGEVGRQLTLIYRYLLISRGPAANAVAAEVIHYTVNANGTVTALHEFMGSECR